MDALPNNQAKLNPETISNNITDPQTADEIYRDSLNATLRSNIGQYVICEFLIGTNSTVLKDGVIYSVGVNFLTLYQEEENRYVVCDIYALKFITFFNSRTRPRNIRVPRNFNT